MKVSITRCCLNTNLAALLMSFVLARPISASKGEQTTVFKDCFYRCERSNCEDETKFYANQDLYLWVLQWSCLDECRYSCMWETVDGLQKNEQPIPQFFGKWPFIRFFGVQEPASVLFSILNGLGHLRILTYRKLVPSTVQMYYVWHVYAFLGLNSWFWSAVFHSKDTNFTEKLDYFSAFAFVQSNCYAAFCRLFGTKSLHTPTALAAILISWFLFHVSYLSFIKFDYGFNMQMNVLVGALNFLAWTTFALKEGIEKPHVQKCAIAVTGMTFLVLLELFDFPPFLWIFDAHSIWHAGTAPLSFLGYSFIIEDGILLAANSGNAKKNGIKKIV